jgi:hypothetical protein
MTIDNLAAACFPVMQQVRGAYRFHQAERIAITGYCFGCEVDSRVPWSRV